jgi:glutamate synthase domain-containing protein 3
MDADELALVYGLVREHFEKTASRRAEAILDVWDVYRAQFWKVAPKPTLVETPTGPRVEISLSPWQTSPARAKTTSRSAGPHPGPGARP